MDKIFTPYFFQYSYYAGKEQSTLISSDFTFEHEYWLKTKIKRLIDSTPELPELMIERILKKTNVS